MEYVFLDWFDGAKRTLSGGNLDIMTEIFNDFMETGTLESVYADTNDETPLL